MPEKTGVNHANPNTPSRLPTVNRGDEQESRKRSASIILDKAVIKANVSGITPALIGQAELKTAPNNSGILVNKIKPNTFISTLGLQNGDIIKEANGNLIKNIASAFTFKDALLKQSAVSLKVQRQGKVIELNYKIQ